MKTKTFLLPAALLASGTLACEAAISFTNIGTTDPPVNFTSGTLASLTGVATANSAVFLLFYADATAPLVSATYAGEALTIVSSTNTPERVRLGYLTNPVASNGDLDVVVNTSAGPAMAYWGVATGIDISNIKTSNTSSISGGTIQVNDALIGLSAGDVVFSAFGVNNAATNTYGGNASFLNRFNGNNSEGDAIFTRDNIVADGDFSPSVAYNSGSTAISGVSIAFNALPAIPEPSSTALLGLAGTALLLRRRRR